MMKHMTLNAIAATCGGTYYGPEENLETVISGIAIDSRKIETNWLFAASEKKIMPITGIPTSGLHPHSKH